MLIFSGHYILYYLSGIYEILFPVIIKIMSTEEMLADISLYSTLWILTLQMASISIISLCKKIHMQTLMQYESLF